MSLFIQDIPNLSSYHLKSTHTGTPYIRVSTGFIDLTTKTTSGTHIQYKIGSQTYRLLQTYTTTDSKQSQYTTTTGYSGVSNRVSSYTVTTGYSGVSSRASTSGYNGSLSRKSTSGYSGKSTYTLSRASTSGWNGWVTYTASRKSTSGYSGKRSSKYTNATSWSGYTKTSYQIRNLFTGYGGNTFEAWDGHASGQANKTGGWANNTNSATGWDRLVTNYKPVKWLIRNTKNNAWFTSGGSYNGSRYSQIQYWDRTHYWYTTSSLVNAVYYTATRTSGFSSAGTAGMSSATALTRSSQYNTQSSRSTTNSAGMLSTTARTRSSAYNTNSNRTSTAVGALVSTTALTRGSTYSTTSTAVGAMSSTAARTRASNYNTSSAAIANMSSTTALTKQQTRTSAYNVTSTATGNMSSITALTKSNTRSSQYNTTTEI